MPSALVSHARRTSANAQSLMRWYCARAAAGPVAAVSHCNIRVAKVEGDYGVEHE